MEKILISAVTDIGKKKINQDAFCIDELTCTYENNHYVFNEETEIDNGFVVSVFDGIGGGSHGEEASKIAVEITNKHLENLRYEEDISEYLNEANDKVAAHFESKKQNGGTTLVSVLLINENDKLKVTAFNIGDSPAYLLKNCNELITLSKEHTLANLKREKDFDNISENDENCLVSYIGDFSRTGAEQAYFYDKNIYFEENDILLVCSDGISKALSEEEIKEIISSDVQNKATKLLDKIYEKDLEHMDNTTAVVLSWK